jgi:ribosomal protein L37AE/L43A
MAMSDYFKKIMAQIGKKRFCPICKKEMKYTCNEQRQEWGCSVCKKGAGVAIPQIK